MPTPAELVKSKLDIVELINGYVKLTPAGSNWKCRCPFHAEKTPSFMVARDKGVWHCFGCGRGGDAIAFVQEIEGMDFPEALQHLAAKAGVELPRSGPRVTSRRAQLLELLNQAASYYARVLTESEQAKPAREYLSKRGVTAESVAEFRLGYAPAAWSSLVDAMRSTRVPEDRMVASGLAVKREGGGAYDRFRGRIMFPITDLSSNVVGFGGRVVEGVDAPGNAEAGKYINSPQSEAFDKGRVLFGLDRARRSIRQRDRVIVVEGYLDCIASHQAGVEHTVATCGTALTPDHVHLLRRFTENVALAFDDDAGGRTAVERALGLLLPEGFDVTVIPLSGGKDPADLAFTDPAAWQMAVGAAQPGMGYLFQRTFADADPKTVEGKKRAGRILVSWLAKLTNPIEQEHYLQELARTLAVPEHTLRPLLERGRPTGVPRAAAPEPKLSSATDRRSAVAERLLALLLAAPEDARNLVRELAPEDLPGGPLRDLYRELVIHYTSGQPAGPEAVATAIGEAAPQLRDRANILLLIGERDFGDLDAMHRAQELAELVREYRTLTVKDAMAVLPARIADAELRKDAKALADLSTEFQRRTDELNRLQRT